MTVQNQVFIVCINYHTDYTNYMGQWKNDCSEKNFWQHWKLYWLHSELRKVYFSVFFRIFLMILILMGINCVIVDCLIMPYYEFDWLIKSLQDVNTESTLFSFCLIHILSQIIANCWLFLKYMRKHKCVEFASNVLSI